MTTHADLLELPSECETCGLPACVTKYVRLPDGFGSLAPVAICDRCVVGFGKNQRPNSVVQEHKIGARIVERGWAKPCRA